MCLDNQYSIPIFGTLLFLSAALVNAQIGQYTPPGGPQEKPESRETQIKREIGAARYHLGPIRLAPDFEVKDVAYVRNLFASGNDAISDLTGTVGAGGRAYLRTGAKMTWIARAMPEYVWWQKRTAARRLNLSYGIEGLGLFNRLFLGVAAGRSEAQKILTPELPQLANARSDAAQVTAEVRLTGTVYTFVTFRQTKDTGLVDEINDPREKQLSLLDRKEQVARGGLRWRPRSGWTLGLGVERSQTDFDRRALDSSNAGTAPVLEVVIDRHQFFFQVDAAARSLKARQGSSFVSFDRVTGGIGAAYQPRRSLQIWLYGNSNLLYSLSPSYPYLLDRRVGVALSLGVGGRLVSRLFAETGTDDYTGYSGGVPDRSDKVRSYGGSLSFLATRVITINAQVTRSRYFSNLGGNDRSYTAGGVSATFGVKKPAI
jgi:hypothetical protein